MGGGLAGASQIGSGQTGGEIALKTAAAIAGGIGMGMLGRRLGANIGQRIHAQPLKDQQGMLATLGRTLGSETTTEGLKQQGQAMKEAVQSGLMNQTSAAMIREAAADPQAFIGRYGITPEQLGKYAPGIQKGQMAAGVARTIESLPPSQRKAMLDQLIGEYEQVEKAMAARAAGSIDQGIEAAAQAFKGETLPGVEGDIGEKIAQLLRPASPVTGEHLGRAAGRFFGDEVGVLGGLVAGSALARQLGLEDPREAKIRDLEAQLSGGGR